MKSSWVNVSSPEKAAIIKADFISSAGLRDRLTELLNAKINASTAISRSKENYALAGWAYLQADAVGYERALKEVISLITENIVE